MLSGKVWLLLGTLVALVALAVACKGGSSEDDSGDGELIPTPVLTPSEETTGFLGEAMAFEFPSNWFIVRNEFDEEEGRETVVVSNVDRDVAPEKLPEGGVRFEFRAEDAQPPEGELGGEVVEAFSLNGVSFTARRGEESPWMVTGGFKIGGVNYGYRADVRINAAELDVEQIKPLLQSWVVGSTNHHPQRTCISPLKCPD
jgi:hypothetical protein